MGKGASEKWLKQAQRDLEWTEANIREKIWYGTCFTAQQTAEKSLKAYLLSKGKTAAKIHDLGALCQMCKIYDEDFENFKESCATLTNYYSPARYPDIAEFMTFSEKEAKEAYKLAKSILDFVHDKI